MLLVAGPVGFFESLEASSPARTGHLGYRVFPFPRRKHSVRAVGRLASPGGRRTCWFGFAPFLMKEERGSPRARGFFLFPGGCVFPVIKRCSRGRHFRTNPEWQRPKEASRGSSSKAPRCCSAPDGPSCRGSLRSREVACFFINLTVEVPLLQNNHLSVTSRHGGWCFCCRHGWVSTDPLGKKSPQLASPCASISSLDGAGVRAAPGGIRRFCGTSGRHLLQPPSCPLQGHGRSQGSVHGTRPCTAMVQIQCLRALE